MDNFKVDIVCVGKADLARAVALAFSHGSNRASSTATHYSITKTHGLTLFWSRPEGFSDVIPLPFKLTAEGATDFIWSWLEGLLEKPWAVDTVIGYEDQPDHDGSNHRGWHLFNENWGHARGSPYGMFSVKPEWAWYGK